MSGGDIRTAREARQVLAIAPGASLDALRAAFRHAVRDAHPDRPGGSAERLRRVLDAHRLLTDLHQARLSLAPLRPAAVAPPAASEPSPKPCAPPAVLAITATEAAAGGAREMTLADGRRGVVRFPPGLRDSDHIRLGGGSAPVLVRIHLTPDPEPEPALEEAAPSARTLLRRFAAVWAA